MEGTRMRARVGPPFVLLGMALVVTAALPRSLQAGLLAAGAPPGCGVDTPVAALRAAGPPRRPDQTARLSALLGKRGELTGRGFTLNLPGRTATFALPAESSVSDAFGDVVLVTRGTVTGSDVLAISLDTGCETRLVSLAEVARGATVDREGEYLYVHGVTRIRRADSGVTQFNVATGAGSMVVPPLAPVDHVGPIFGTDLRWSLDGSALAVQSCGFRECITRILDVATGEVARYAQPGQGAFIGLTRGHLLAYGACPGLPCAVLSTDLSTGAVTTLADEAFGASITATQDGDGRLSIETAAGKLEFEQ